MTQDHPNHTKPDWEATMQDNHTGQNNTDTKRTRRSPRPSGLRMGISASEVNFTRADSMSEKIRRVAWVAPLNEINMMQTAELLMAAGQTTSNSRRNVLGMIHRIVNKSSDYKKVRWGWYLYIGPPVELPEDEPDPSPEPPQYATPRVAERVAMRWRRGKVEYHNDMNLAQKLRAVANHTYDRVVEPGQTADRMLRDGQSYAKKRNLTRVIHRTLKEDPEFRELSAPATGWYRYCPSRSLFDRAHPWPPAEGGDEAFANTLSDTGDTPWGSAAVSAPTRGHSGDIGNHLA